MRPVRQTYSTTGAGFLPWVPISYLEGYFNVGLAVLPSSAAGGASFSAQYTMDDLSTFRVDRSFSQTTTTVTINDPLHGLSVGDSVGIQRSNAGIDGVWQVASIVDINNYTVTVTKSQSLVSTLETNILRVFTSTGIPAASAARINTNLTQPATAVRLAVAALTSGSLDFLVLQGL
jgi:hypothetical protein